ncbi:MAG: DUF3488 and transglutaminase-like domain-containing protein [Acidimicrobiia bacterium]
MAYRLTWIAGLGLLGLVIARLSRLLLPTESGLPWPVVLIMAAALGGIVTWAATQARLGAGWVVLINVVLFGLFLFIYVGGDIAESAIPPLDVIDDVRHEMGDALTVFRFSAPPVVPLVGLVALIGVLLWVLTGLAVWGVLRNNPYLAVVPPVVLYLQLAVIDRQDAAWGWMLAFLVLVGLGLVAIAADQRSGGSHAGSGFQAARVRGVAVPLLSVAVVAAGALAATSALGDQVPQSGVFDWRTQAGLGAGYGSISYNPFIDIQRSLVSNSDTPIFTAKLEGENTDNVYWRLLTMDTFNGDWWYASAAELESIQDTRWERDDFAFRGRTESISAEVTILKLQTQWLPAPYSPTSVESNARLIDNTTRIRPDDASIHIDGVTRSGMVYQLTADIPQPDVRILAGGRDGSLSPLFEAAAQESRFPPVPAPGSSLELPTADHERYTELPRDFPPAISKLARDLTFGLKTDYEKGLALENYFRAPGSIFTYSIDIPPNERNSGLEEWLLGDSPGSRTGYCEQFSASMGVMARSLGIPTRTVLGFTPGQLRSNGITTVILDRNAHAWVELWMPSQGWVRFDPTPRGDGVNPSTSANLGFDLDRYLEQVAADEQARLDNAPVPPAVPPRELDPGNDEIFVSSGFLDSVGGFQLPSWLIPSILWTLVIGLAAGIVPFLKRRRRRYRLRRLDDGDVEAAWAEMVDHLLDSGFRVDPASTPSEVAAVTDVAMGPLASVYSESTYGPESEMPAEAVETAAASLHATVTRMRSRMSRWERTRRIYRMKSLLPGWVKRAQQRRRRD